MSLTSRSAYLAKLAQEAIDKTQPIKEEFEKIKVIKEKAEADLASRIKSFDDKIEKARLEGKTERVKSIESSRDEFRDSFLASISKTTQTLLDSIENTLNSIIKDIDGVAGTVSVDLNSLSLDIQPELLNKTTDFVKESLVSPETKIIVNTTLTGTAGPYTLTGTGTQVANITTT